MTDPQVPFKRGSDVIDAANIPFTPTTLGNWTGSADPGGVDDALDQIAGRVVVTEAAIAAGAAATGTLTFVDGVQNEFNVSLTIGDGVRTLVIPLVNAGGTANVGYVVDVGGGASFEAACARFQAVLETYFNFKVSRTAGVISLTNRQAGRGGNVTITSTIVNLTVSGMSGGTGGAATFPTINPGVAQVFTMPFAAQPTTGDTMRIGNDTYQFRPAAASLTNDAYKAVLIGADAAATLVNLVAAINATDADNAHASIFKTNGTTPALANGTEPYRADVLSTTLRVRSADAAGSTKIVGSAYRATLGESITDAGVIWDTGNVNTDTLGGSYPSPMGGACSVRAITADDVTAGYVRFVFPFRLAKGSCIVQVRTSAGLLRAPMVTDAVSIDNGGVKITLTSADLTDIDAGDVITVIAFPS